jgi:hypothetical protein
MPLISESFSGLILRMTCAPQLSPECTGTFWNIKIINFVQSARHA